MLNKFIFSGAVGLLALSSSALAQDEPSGMREYMNACAVCHGESGMGDGPMAEHLEIDVPSVTTLKKQNDGVFPFLQTFMIIDGRTGVRGHGTGMMPVWGDRYKATAEAMGGMFNAEVMARGRLLSLVYYLESIQE